VTAAASSGKPRAPLALEIGAAAAVLAYSYVIVRLVPSAVYVPVNLAAAGLAVALVHARGAGWDDLGLARATLGRGLRLGLLTVLPIAAVVATGVALTVSRTFFVEARFTDLDTAQKLYELLVRIPLGTALAEELIFRGALLGLYLRRHTFLKATLLSSLVFGLWHVVGAMAAVQSNAAGEVLASPAAQAVGVLATVVATGAAGMVFCWLRRRSGSVVTPAITHAALNGLAVVGGLVAARWLGG
jgi:membrane protease YdiL (CAAX protease family)